MQGYAIECVSIICRNCLGDAESEYDVDLEKLRPSLVGEILDRDYFVPLGEVVSCCQDIF